MSRRPATASHCVQPWTPGARFLLDLATKAVFAAEPRDLSLLHALFYLHSGGGIINLASTAGGAQDSRFVGGSLGSPLTGGVVGLTVVWR